MVLHVLSFIFFSNSFAILCTQVKLGVHCFSCLYGTFLCNSMKEREEDRVGEDTYPVWSLLHEGNTEVLNYLYKPGRSVLCPVTNIKHMALWTELYLSPCLVGYGTQRAPREYTGGGGGERGTDMCVCSG